MLTVDSLSSVILDLDGCYSILFGIYAAALIGDRDDIEDFLTTIGGDDDDATLRLQRRHSEKGVRTLLRAGGVIKVGVIVLLEDVDSKLEAIPIKGILYDGIAFGRTADGTGSAKSSHEAIVASQDDMGPRVGAVRIAACLATDGVLGEGLLSSKDKLVGNEG